LDLQAEERVQGHWQPCFIECKGHRFLGPHEIDQCIEQIEEYRETSAIRRAILAFPGNILPEGRSLLLGAGIEVWDREYLENRFHAGIVALNDPRAKMIFGLRPRTAHSPASLLEEKLLKTRPGREDWPVFQNLVRDIFELLFTPPLSKSFAEFADSTGTNRRDIIMPNYATAGFWMHARDAYRADYIVVDAKNHSGPIPKSEVLNVANYLKPYGAGMFAIIVTRFGAGSGAIATLRELWSKDQKLIVVMDDNDVRAMLTMFAANDAPDQILVNLITRFRLAM
jgi:hypothetical protein